MLSNKDRSRIRWLGNEQDELLTWGVRWRGDSFVDELTAHCPIQPEWSILEIGPGYGRILRTFQNRNIRFIHYLGLDLNVDRTGKLQKELGKHNISFLHGDVETLDIPERFNLCISSATFSHLFPDFSAAVINIRKHLKPPGWLVFDVSPGKFSGFISEGTAYGRDYESEEITNILTRCGYDSPDISTVRHGMDAHGNPVELVFVATKLI